MKSISATTNHIGLLTRNQAQLLFAHQLQKLATSRHAEIFVKLKIIATVCAILLMVISSSNAQVINSWRYEVKGDQSNGEMYDQVNPTDIAADNSGNFISLGYYQSSIRSPLNLNAGSFATDQNQYLIKRNSTGGLMWGRNLGSTSFWRNVETDASGNIFVGGGYNAGPGNQDPLVWKINPATGDVVKGIGFVGSSASDYINQIVIDGSGNVLVFGYAGASMDIDPGAGVTNVTGYFLAIYSNDLTFVRKVNLPPLSYDSKVGVDGDGNILVTGGFNGTLDFNPDPAITFNLTTTTRNAFLAKYTTTGAFVWAYHIVSSSDVITASQISADGSGNVYLNGKISGSADFDPTASALNVNTNGNGDVFVAKYNSVGTVIYAFNIGNTNEDYSFGFEVKNTGDIYVTGSFSGTVDLNPSPTETFNVTSRNGTAFSGDRVYIAKYNSSGQFSLGKLLEGNQGNSIDIDGKDNLFVQVAGTGNYMQQVTILKMCEAPPVTVTASKSLVCDRESIQLTAAGAVTYAWSGPLLSAATGDQVTATPSYYTNVATYTVVGTNANGCTGTATVTVNIHPQLITVSPSFGTSICPEGSATLQASGGSSTYTWTPTAGLSAATGATVVAKPTQTTTYTVSGPDSNGCTSSKSVTVTVHTSPTIVVTPPSGESCVSPKTVVTFTASGASSYSWAPSTGLSGTTGDRVEASPSATTTYTVTGTNGYGCKNTAKVTYNINVTTVTVNSAQYCSGGSATLTAGGASTYMWTPSTGLSSTSGASVTASPSTSTSYTVVGTNSTTGCSGSASSVVRVDPNPATPSITGADTYCGSTIGLSASASGANSYIWSTGATAASVSLNAPGTYSVQGKSLYGCLSAAASKVVTDSRPILSAIATSTIEPCAVSATLTASSGSGYSWYYNDNLLTSNSSSSLAISKPGSYYAKVVNPSGCPSTTLATGKISIEDKNPIVAYNATTCAGTSVALSGSPSGGTWSGSGVSGSSFYSPSAGTYTVTYTATVNGCTKSANSTVSVLPNPAITSLDGPAAVCPGNLYTYTVYASGSNLSYSWTYPSNWYVNSQYGNSITLQVPTYSPSYGTVRVTVSNGQCSTIDGRTVYPGSCGGTTYYSYSLAPNPADEEVTIESEHAFENNRAIKIYDQTGKLVAVETMRGGDKRKTISTGKLTPGLYHVHLISKDGIEQQKLLIIH